MPGRFKNKLQVAILYDGLADVSPASDLDKFRMAMSGMGIPLRITQEAIDCVFMLGDDGLQLTCSYYYKPADPDVFKPVLELPFTRMMFRDVGERVRRHRSHVLIEVQQGFFGGVEDKPEFLDLFEKSGIPLPGHSLESYNRRVDVLAQACLFLHRERPASAVHWTQSGVLIPGEALEHFLKQRGPGFLTVHPVMFGGEEIPGYKARAGEIVTIGAADYVGREIHTDPVPIPWSDIYGSIIAFIEMAIMPNGYIIPDGDTFGIDTDEFSWLVTHPDGKERKTFNGEPLYNLKLLYHRQYGYTAPDFAGRELIKGGIAEASLELHGSRQARREQVETWNKTEDMARKAGSEFQIYRINDPVPPKTPFGSGGGRPTAVFGKRKT